MQSGDSDALIELFNAFYNDVYYFALKTIKDDDLACDITQETFVEIINTIGELHEPAAFVKWMKQVTYHQCTRYFKKKKDVLVDEDEEGNTIFDINRMILWGEEEQGSKRSFRRKAETEPNGLCDDDGARGAAPCSERSDAKQPGLQSSGLSASQSAHTGLAPV